MSLPSPTAHDLAHTLSATAHELVALGLAWGASGNLSARLGSDTMLVSGSGVGLGRLTPEDFPRCLISTGAPLEGSGRKPSKEVPMHAAIYRARPDARVILHASPPSTTLCACAGKLPPAGLFIETMFFLERPAWVDYHPPGSAELGQDVGKAAAQAEVIMLRNHGVILHDETFADALMRLQTLELACSIWLQARAARLPLKPVPPGKVQEFLASGRYRPSKPWHTRP